MGVATKAYLGSVLAAGTSVVAWSIWHWHSQDLFRFLVYLAISGLASGMKVVLPSLNGTMSANFLFVLIGVAELSLPETLVMGCLGIAVQSIWHARQRPRPVQVAFNMASMALAVAAAHWVFNLPWFRENRMEAPIVLGLAAAVFFVANTFLVALIIAFTEWKPVWQVWKQGYFWTFPAYLVGAALAALTTGMSRWIGWQTSLLILPVLYLIHNFQKLNVERLEEAKRLAEKEKQHANEKSSIHLRTIEALAMAIEAKDGTTHDHLERVQVYAIEVGKELGLTEAELEAVRAASILHDVGKLAVPEYIISKPGKLTPAEFEKMKIHPVVGAQILDQVQFPYPVSPIVRSHHEKWDGSGYPDGLSGEAIPIGARILSAVDCLDALASDRQYRRALPLPEAMAVVARDSGKSFDPRVVEVLQRRYVDLEQSARRSQHDDRPKLQTDLKIERGAAPAAGFAAGDDSTQKVMDDVARLHEKITDFSYAEIFGELAKNLKVGIGFDALAVFVEKNETLEPVYVQGLAAAMLSQLKVPMGQGLVGWVAENHKAIVNANPTVEPGFFQPSDGGAGLTSALACPVESERGPLGVVCLYRVQRDGFTSEHLRILQALSVGSLDRLTPQVAA